MSDKTKPTGRGRVLSQKSVPFNMKSAADSDGGCEFEGVVACYCSIDHAGEMFVPGCFDAGLPTFQAEGVVRDEHYVTTGKILEAKSLPEGLWIRGRVLPTAAGKDQA